MGQIHWRDLEVWKQAHALTLEIYKASSSFPKSEMYGVVDQLRRSASSVAANIVEGQSRNTTKDYVNFLFNSRGSLEELRYFMLLSKDLNYLSVEESQRLEDLAASVSRLLNGLIGALKRAKV